MNRFLENKVTNNYYTNKSKIGKVGVNTLIDLLKDIEDRTISTNFNNQSILNNFDKLAYNFSVNINSLKIFGAYLSKSEKYNNQIINDYNIAWVNNMIDEAVREYNIVKNGIDYSANYFRDEAVREYNIVKNGIDYSANYFRDEAVREYNIVKNGIDYSANYFRDEAVREYNIVKNGIDYSANYFRDEAVKVYDITKNVLNYSANYFRDEAVREYNIVKNGIDYSVNYMIDEAVREYNIVKNGIDYSANYFRDEAVREYNIVKNGIDYSANYFRDEAVKVYDITKNVLNYSANYFRDEAVREYNIVKNVLNYSANYFRDEAVREYNIVKNGIDYSANYFRDEAVKVYDITKNVLNYSANYFRDEAVREYNIVKNVLNYSANYFRDEAVREYNIVKNGIDYSVNYMIDEAVREYNIVKNGIDYSVNYMIDEAVREYNIVKNGIDYSVNYMIDEAVREYNIVKNGIDYSANYFRDEAVREYNIVKNGIDYSVNYMIDEAVREYNIVKNGIDYSVNYMIDEAVREYNIVKNGIDYSVNYMIDEAVREYNIVKNGIDYSANYFRDEAVKVYDITKNVLNYSKEKILYSAFNIIDSIDQISDSSNHIYHDNMILSKETLFKAVLSETGYYWDTKINDDAFIKDNIPYNNSFMLLKNNINIAAEKYPFFRERMNNLEILEAEPYYAFIKEKEYIDNDQKNGHICHVLAKGTKMSNESDILNDVYIALGLKPPRLNEIETDFKKIVDKHPECTKWEMATHSLAGRFGEELGEKYHFLNVESFETGRVSWDNWYNTNPFISFLWGEGIFNNWWEGINKQYDNITSHRILCDAIAKGPSPAGTTHHYNTCNNLNGNFQHSIKNFIDANIKVLEKRESNTENLLKIHSILDKNFNVRSSLIDNNEFENTINDQITSKLSKYESLHKVETHKVETHKVETHKDSQNFNNNLRVFQKYVSNINTGLSIINLAKNWSNINTEDRLFIEYAYTLKSIDLYNQMNNITTDPIINYLSNLCINGKPDIKNVIFISIEEKLGISCKNILNSLDKVVHDKTLHSKDYFMIASDIILYLIPELKIIYFIYNLGTLLNNILTKYNSFDIAGITISESDRISIHINLESGHRIKLWNEYFDIHISTWNEHYNEGHKEAIELFKKKAHTNVFRKIGIPFELLDKPFNKNCESIEFWKDLQYKNSSYNFWLKNSELSTEECDLLSRICNETDSEKQLRIFYQQHNIEESFINKNLHVDIVQFIRKIYYNLSNINSFDDFIDKILNIFFNSTKINENSNHYTYAQWLEDKNKYFNEHGGPKSNDSKNWLKEYKQPIETETEFNKRMQEWDNKREKYYMEHGGEKSEESKKWLKKHPKPKPQDILQDDVDEIINNKILTKEQKEILDKFNNSNTTEWINSIDNYSKFGIIKFVNYNLLSNEISVGFLTGTLSAAYLGIIANSIAHIDLEIKQFFKNTRVFLKSKCKLFISSFLNIGIATIITNHMFTTWSLLFLNKLPNIIKNMYIAPIFSLFTSIIISTIGKFDIKEFGQIIKNNFIPGIKLSFGVVYNYAVQNDIIYDFIGFNQVSIYIKNKLILAFNYIEKNLLVIEKKILMCSWKILKYVAYPFVKLIKVSLKVISLLTITTFIGIMTVVSIILVSVLVRVYNHYRNITKKQLGKIKPDWKVSPFVPDWKFNNYKSDLYHSPFIPEYKRNRISPDWKKKYIPDWKKKYIPDWRL